MLHFFFTALLTFFLSPLLLIHLAHYFLFLVPLLPLLLLLLTFCWFIWVFGCPSPPSILLLFLSRPIPMLQRTRARPQRHDDSPSAVLPLCVLLLFSPNTHYDASTALSTVDCNTPRTRCPPSVHKTFFFFPYRMKTFNVDFCCEVESQLSSNTINMFILKVFSRFMCRISHSQYEVLLCPLLFKVKLQYLKEHSIREKIPLSLDFLFMSH